MNSDQTVTSPVNKVNTNDARAVNEARKGNSRAFGEIVLRYHKQVFNLSLMLMKNPQNAEEVTQDAFVRAYNKLDRYDSRQPFYPWLATIAVRLAQTRLRRKQFELHEQDPDTIPGVAPDPLASLLRDEQKMIWKLLTDLPSGERTAVFLVYKQELTVTEAAKAIGVTSGTIKTLLFRARKHLRIALNESEEDQ